MPSRLTFIDLTELLELLANDDKPVIVDVLPADSYAEGHVPKALSIPLKDLAEKAPSMLPDKNATIVVHCSNFSCQASTKAAKLLTEMGYAHVLDFKGGRKAWADAGLPIEKS